MIISYEFKDGNDFYRGIIETTGFWLKFAEDKGDIEDEPIYKVWGAFNFAYASPKKEKVLNVLKAFEEILKGEKNRVILDGVVITRLN